MTDQAAVRPPLRRDDEGAVATLTLDRPRARNALGLALLDALLAELRRIELDPNVRAVVIAAEGPAFCAGHDLKELTSHRGDPDGGRAFFTEVIDRCSQTMLRLPHLPQPVIAAVEGMATAAGCQLVAACDLAVAGNGARFATPGVQIGLFCTTPMVPLTRAIAPRHALEMLLTGAPVDAREAHRLGLVNRVVPAGEALAQAQTLAREIAARSPLTVRIGKRAFYAQRQLDLEAAYRQASEVMVENLLARDAQEGIGAFLEKREPHWEGR